MSKSLKGKVSWSKGKTGIYSEEVLKRMSEAKKGKYKPSQKALDNGRKAVIKPVIQYNLQGEFIKEWESITEASTTLNLNHGNISACLRERQETAFGFKWEYKTKQLKFKIWRIKLCMKQVNLI